MKLRIEAEPEELTQKAFDLVLGLAHRLSAHDARLAALVKANKPAVRRRVFAGLACVIENPAGSTRYWTDKASGRSGQTKMLYDYGYVDGAVGADGDDYDVYLGPDENAPLVFVVHQRRPDTGELYDEDKALLGFVDQHAAEAAFLAHYDDPRFLGSVTVMTVEEFKSKVFNLRDGVMKSKQRDHEFVIPDARLAKGDVGVAAVDAGVSGPNIALRVPDRHRPDDLVHLNTAAIDAQGDLAPDAVRGAIEQFNATREEDRLFALRRNPTVYQTARLKELPVHARPEWESRGELAVAAIADGPANLALIQMQVDRRVLANTAAPNKLLPRDPRDVRLFIPLPDGDVGALETSLKSESDGGTETREPEGREPPRPEVPDPAVALSATIKKSGVGDVELHARVDGSFVVDVAGALTAFSSMSQACDHVWCLQKGFSDVAAWRAATGKRKVPSGAGWAFWGVDARDPRLAELPQHPKAPRSRR